MRHGGDTPLGCDRQKMGQHRVTGGRKRGPPLPLVDRSRKTVRTDLAEERIFHIGNVMKG